MGMNGGLGMLLSDGRRKVPIVHCILTYVNYRYYRGNSDTITKGDRYGWREESKGVSRVCAWRSVISDGEKDTSGTTQGWEGDKCSFGPDKARENELFKTKNILSDFFIFTVFRFEMKFCIIYCTESPETGLGFLSDQW